MSTTTTPQHPQQASPTRPAGIDPRGPQFAAALTSIALIAVLLLAPGPAAVVVLALQAAVFAVGAARGVQHTPLLGHRIEAAPRALHQSTTFELACRVHVRQEHRGPRN